MAARICHSGRVKFRDLVTNVSTAVFDRTGRTATTSFDDYNLSELCQALLSTRGEASGVALATAALARYSDLDEREMLDFFLALAKDFDPDPAEAIAAAEQFAASDTPEDLATLIETVEPPRQALFRRLNQAPGGTGELVAMREDLLGLIADHPTLRRVDTDLRHLFASWFNRGFLVLEPITWDSPAAVLEKIIDYEAVHAIGSWDELRARLDPADRRCYGFFHPAMPGEPLVFVEVALTVGTPDAIGYLLADHRGVLDPDRADTAVFYSISNCQNGLRGISFGHFLIKQVVNELRRDVPNINRFVTLSPAPGFANWVKTQAANDMVSAQELLALVGSDNWERDPNHRARHRQLIEYVGARYYLYAKNAKGKPLDPVARFHLGNGAFLAGIKPQANLSAAGMTQSLGMMVSYRYRLDRIEANHEAYATDQEIRAAATIIDTANGELPTPPTD